ncbi:hypothetical protein J2Z53_002140 [Clostridium moniliforme]|uniref:Uncharacterized protein n=1 Tax=Clostridium moniliforme TaxID=39489 RepID=A0ABS4F2Q2_9CLOT|nr:hypothetical protein [Clostridium moniliforme]MBP1890540.1 hypothetical protein [Clostridium moniliforme]
MRYVALVILLLSIMFLCIFTFTIFINRKNSVNKNLKITIMMMTVTLPIISLVGGTLFLTFKLVEVIMPINISTFNIFIISIIGVFIIFICDLASKQLLATLAPIIFANKYKNENLNEKEIMEIIEESQKKINIITLIIMFIITCILYMLIMKIIDVDFNLIFLTIISLSNLICYRIFFRRSKLIE